MVALCAPDTPLGAQATPATVYELADVTVRPQVLNSEELGAALYARYPAHLRQAAVNGRVIVSMIVGADGQPRDITVISSSNADFDSATLEIAARLRFSPAQVSGHPVDVRFVAPIAWQAAAEAPRANDLSNLELPRPSNIHALAQEMQRLYPAALWRDRIDAVVNVRFRVLTDGTVADAFISQSSDSRFNEATLAAVQVLRFQPGKLNGQPVIVWVEQPIQWIVAQ